MSQPTPAYDYLFDIGNVILFFDFGRFARAIAPKCAYSAEEILALTNDPKEEMEAQGVSADAFVRDAMERLDYQGTQAEFVAAWQNIFELNTAVAQLIANLAARGSRLLLLSNTNQLHVDYFTKEYPVFEHFENWVYSHEAGCSKPDPAIYEHTIAKLGVVPERTYYIDDLKANVEASRSFGFQTIHYTRQDLTTHPAFRLAS